MKKLLKAALSAAAALTAAVCLSMNAFAYESGSVGIDDQANLYTEEEEAMLEARQQEVADLTGWNIAVVTTDVGFGEDGYNAIEYAEDYYDETFGYSSSGLLYLIDIDYRHICISGQADYEYFNDARAQTMFKKCNEKYMDYDDVGNLMTFYEYVEETYKLGPYSNGKVYGKKMFSLPAALIVGIISAVIGVLVVRGRYKFHPQPSTNQYLDGNKVNFYRRQDMFVREFTTRTNISSNSSGGGSHGGHGSGGGHSHGGAGGGGRR